MKFFIDAANVADIKKANDMEVICGVTINPSLIAKEGIKINETLIFSAKQALLAARAGDHIATVPYVVSETMTKNLLTYQGIEKFQKDYKAVFGE